VLEEIKGIKYKKGRERREERREARREVKERSKGEEQTKNTDDMYIRQYFFQ